MPVMMHNASMLIQLVVVSHLAFHGVLADSVMMRLGQEIGIGHNSCVIHACDFDMSGLRKCFCSAHSCKDLPNGSLLPYRQWRQHQDQDVADLVGVDELSSALAMMVFRSGDDGIPPAPTGIQSFAPVPESDKIKPGSMYEAYLTATLLTQPGYPVQQSHHQHFNPEHHNIHLASSTAPADIMSTDQLYSLMTSLEADIIARQQQFEVCDILQMPLASGSINRDQIQASLSTLQAEFAWYSQAHAAVLNALVPSYAAPHVLHLRRDMVERLERQMDLLARYICLKQKVLGAAAICGMDSHMPDYLWAGNPVVFGLMMIVLVLSCLENVSREACNFLLQGMKFVLQAHLVLVQGDEKIRRFEERLLQQIPADLRTVESTINLKPNTLVYACCPSCCALYKPSDFANGVPTYPSRCSEYISGNKSCHARLLRFASCGGRTVKVPIRPFVYRSFSDFTAQILVNPDVEDDMDKSWVKNNSAVSSDLPESPYMCDIWDGYVFTNFKGRDGKPFGESSGTDAHDAHLIWSLNVDWFNPFRNKIAGKKVSFGVILMACLNLPPSLRYRSENMYLAGVIPGPQEPAGHQMNHFLSPLVDDLLVSWQGVWYTRTARHPLGRMVTSALIPVINDVPAARKASGTTGHSARRFCHRCMLYKENINDFRFRSWPRRDYATHLALAKHWCSLTTKTARDKFFASHGVRWTELLRLSYWDPTQFVIVDPMHNLFLGLIRYHYRVVLGTDDHSYDSGEALRPTDIPSQSKVKKGLRTLGQNPTAAAMNRLSMPVLYALCSEKHISLDATKVYKKRELISCLLDLIPVSDLQARTLQYEEEPARCDATSDALPSVGLSVSAPHINPPLPQPQLSDTNLAEIQADIKKTVRPSWHQAPPSNFGLTRHGKLTAEQWRTCMEFDLPVSLVRMWSELAQLEENAETSAHYRLLIDNIMNLAIAVLIATSHRTSRQHSSKYMKYMTLYLQGLEKLGHRLVPNHHYALHIGELLLMFGPVRGWWTFPYERVIGMMARIHTNSKIGQMEKTIMDRFSASSKLHSLFRNAQLMGSMETLVDTTLKIYGNSSNLLDDRLSYRNGSSESLEGARRIRIGPAIAAALRKLPTCIHVSDDQYFWVYRSFRLFGRKFTDHATQAADSVIFFRDSTVTTSAASFGLPGIITSIFSLEQTDNVSNLYCVISPYAPSRAHSNPIMNPFLGYSDFQISLWSSYFREGVFLISTAQIISHAIYRVWCNDVLIFRPLNRNF